MLALKMPLKISKTHHDIFVTLLSQLSVTNLGGGQGKLHQSLSTADSWNRDRNIKSSVLCSQSMTVCFGDQDTYHYFSTFTVVASLMVLKVCY